MTEAKPVVSTSKVPVVPVLYDAVSNPKPKDTAASPVIYTTPTTSKEESNVKFNVTRLTNTISPLGTKESDEVDDRNEAAISTLNFRDDSNVKDPFSAKTITGDSDLKQPVPVFTKDVADPDPGVPDNTTDDTTDLDPNGDNDYVPLEDPVPVATKKCWWWWLLLAGGAGTGIVYLVAKKRKSKKGKR
jgi:hypothetical protein